jgi:hypothetical protein
MFIFKENIPLEMSGPSDIQARPANVRFTPDSVAKLSLRLSLARDSVA